MTKHIINTGKSLFEEEIRGRKSKIHSLSRHSKGYHQAVVKVSYASGAHHARQHADYISRKSDLPVEYLNGDEHYIDLDREGVKQVLDGWKRRYDQRTDSRDVAKIILSTPEGSEPDKTKKAARAFIKETFPDRACMFALHTDTKHPHVHVMLEMKNQQGNKLRAGPRELHKYREAFAEACRDQGLAMDASYRSERGVYQKPKKQYQKHINKETYRTYGNFTNQRQVVIKKASRLDSGKPLKQEIWHEKMMHARQRQMELLTELIKLAERNKRTKEKKRLEKIKKNFPEVLTRSDKMAIHLHKILKEKEKEKNKQPRFRVRRQEENEIEL